MKKTPAEATREQWETLAKPTAEALTAMLISGALEVSGDPARAANYARMTIGYIGCASNMALDIGDDAWRPCTAFFERGCASLTAAVEEFMTQVKRAGELPATPTRRQIALCDAAGVAFAEAAEEARKLLRLRGGRSETIRDVAEIHAEMMAAQGRDFDDARSMAGSARSTTGQF
jgi:hypothetical protein